MNNIDIKLSEFDRRFWYIMYLFLFGYSCLGIPGMAGMRSIICGCVIVMSLIVYSRCIKLKYHDTLATYILFVTILAIVMGILNGGTVTGQVLDTTVSISVILAIYMMRFPPAVILRFLSVSAICSFLFFLWSFIHNPFGTDEIVSRGAIDTEAFIGACMLWPLALTVAFVTVLKKDFKPYYFFLGYAYWVLCIIMNMMFLKRAIFTDSAFLILALIWYYKWCQNKSFFSTFSIVIISVAVMLFLSDTIFVNMFKIDLTAVTERIGERFDEIETGTVRIDESNNYFSRASFLDIIFGKGFGVAHYGLGFDKTNTALHIGINNLVLKHGVFMVPLYVVMVLKVVSKALIRPKLTKMQQVCAITVLASFPTFVSYTNFWLTSPIYCFMWYAIFCVYFKNNINGKKTSYYI